MTISRQGREWISDHGVPDCDLLVGKIQRPSDPLSEDRNWKVDWIAMNGERGTVASPQRAKVINTMTQLKKTRKVWTAEVEAVQAITGLVDGLEGDLLKAARR
jgi:hypothetical protein